MKARMASALVQDRLRSFPAVILVGPRQCGKTTLARQMAALYFDIEQDADRVRLDLGWDDVTAGRQLVVLDEAQVWPELFPRLRGAIDARRKQMGRFLLLGSVSPGMMARVSESLAGRMAIVDLTPFHLAELPPDELDRLWRLGGYPDGGILGDRAFPQWQNDYLRLMAERDLPEWGLPARPAQTLRLMRMLAAEHAAIVNWSKLGQSLGISYHTVQSHVDYLVGAGLVRLLPPFEANLRKRLVKAPRVYWRDSGLLHALRGMGPQHDLRSEPWVGQSWEGFVLEQILARESARGGQFEASYFRTHDGLECDLVLARGRSRELIEIKLTTAPAPEDFARLAKVADLLGNVSRQVLLSRTRDPVTRGARWSTGLSEYLAATA